MPWTDPVTFYDGDPLTAAQLNTFIRDNLLETGPGKATTASRLITTANVNQIEERQWSHAYAGASLTVDNKFPSIEENEGEALGPSLTVDHGGQMLIMYDCRIYVDDETGNAMYAPVVNGDLPETSNYAVRSGREGIQRSGGWFLWEGEPGLAEITMAYGIYGNGTVASYAYRLLSVLA